jgi:general stress protein 26
VDSNRETKQIIDRQGGIRRACYLVAKYREQEMNEALSKYLKDKMMADLATVEGLQPRVRPITLMYYRESFWIATGKSDAKSRQIEQNPLVEAVYILKGEQNTGYIRISGSLAQISDLPTRKDLADWSGFIYEYFDSPENPDLAIYQLVPSSIRLMNPGDMYETEMLQE